ncbi:MAG: isochorismatase family cysteine hydrolase [Dehalococcoidales bacterium]|nr:isochorismatase family cysteine hydrolase [Dehalococcoidales bacterium]
MAKIDINKESSALLVMDCQETILKNLSPSEKSRVLTNVSRALSSARKAGMLVVYVVVQFRDGYPEVSPNNARFASARQSGRLRQSDLDSQICAEIRPQVGEVIVTKKRIGAFAGSDLDVILRSNGINTLFLAGVSSLGVVESTARLAVDMDYRVFVLGDCCADRDPKANEVALSILLPWITTVCSTDDLIGAMG